MKHQLCKNISKPVAGFGQKSNRTSKDNLTRINKQLNQLTSQAIYAYQQGRLETAKNLIQAVIKNDSKDGFAIGILATIEKAMGNAKQSAELFELALTLDAHNASFHHNYSGLLVDTMPGKAVEHSLAAIRIKPNDAEYLSRCGYAHWKAGDLKKGSYYCLQAINTDPRLAVPYTNLGSILQEQGQLEQALAAFTKAIELKPNYSKAFYGLATINMARGEIETAKAQLTQAIRLNIQEVGAYYELSITIESTTDAENLINAAQKIDEERLSTKEKAQLGFVFSNCFHKLKLYDEAAKNLRRANANKLIAMPSNAEALIKRIGASNTREFPVENVKDTCGQGRIFIVGMPRSGSTLLETILSTNTSIKDLGETRALAVAIEEKTRQSTQNLPPGSIDDLYTKYLNNPDEDTSGCTYRVDKQLYNFMNAGIIATHMPAAKIIHSKRNPMDNTLSMHRSNLTAGNNFTSDLKDAANVMVEQEKTMQAYKKKYPDQIYTFNYDAFVSSPEGHLRHLLAWLGLEWNEDYLHPEKSKRTINTASVIQARRPISNKSVGGWLNYRSLLEPAEEIVRRSGLFEI